MSGGVDARVIGSRWELMVDDWLIETLRDAGLRLHHPVAREVALRLDAPWEGAVSHYATVLEFEGEYRLYYRGQRGSDSGGPPVTAVASSRDGIRWERPQLGLFEWEGSRANNIVWIGEASATFAPFVDANPAAAPAQRFKAVAAARLPGAGPRGRGLVPFVSADGYRWQQWQAEPIITEGAFDSQNLAFWDSHRGHYVAFFRDFRDGVRSIKRATSPDFLTWSEPEWLDFGAAPPEHLYTNAAVSYSRAPHLYLAFPKRFVPGRQAVPEHLNAGLSDGVFMSSRDGVRWDRRFLEAFLRPGRDRENWTDRTNGIAWGLLQTAVDELSLYWIEHYRHPTARLRRGTLRLDGFVSANAGYAGGEVVTRPLRFEGDELALNYATSAAGSVRAELQDADSRPIPGYTLDESVELYGDAIEQPVRWRHAHHVGALASRPIRLRLVLRDADVYALRFRPSPAGASGAEARR